MNDGQTEPRLVAAAPAPPARDVEGRIARCARAAYECFVATVGYGREMPPWDLLADKHRDAWFAAARGVIIEQTRDA